MKTIILILVVLLSSCRDDSWVSNYEHDDFVLNGSKCTLVHPISEPNGEWIVRPAFIGEFSQVDDSLLAKGYTMAYCDVRNEYGSYKAQEKFYQFYELVRKKYNLAEKFIIEGLSRGGYFALFFAENHPECIKKIYIDAPVCDLYSWPLKADSLLFEDAKRKWEECGVPLDSIHDYPIKNFRKILDIPLIVVYGDADTTVPFAENFGRVDISGHKAISIIKKENVGHHPHSLLPCDTIVNFLMKETE